MKLIIKSYLIIFIFIFSLTNFVGCEHELDEEEVDYSELSLGGCDKLEDDGWYVYQKAACESTFNGKCGLYSQNWCAYRSVGQMKTECQACEKESDTALTRIEVEDAPITDEPTSPKPIYWSKLENTDISNNAEYHVEGHVPTYTITKIPFNIGSSIKSLGYFTTIASILNNGNKAGSSSYKNHYQSAQVYIKPFDNYKMNWNQGTVSVWFKLENYYITDPKTILGSSKIEIGSAKPLTAPAHIFDIEPLAGGYPLHEINYFCINLYYHHPWTTGDNNAYINLRYSNQEIKDEVTITPSVFNHLFVVWKRSGLNSGYTIRIFINNSEIISRSDQWSDASSEEFNILLASDASNQYYSSLILDAYSAIDNLKIWNEVFTEDPTEEFNNGHGLE